MILIVILTSLGIKSSAQQTKATDDDSWWLTPHRLLQTNLREIDATMNTDQYAREAKEFCANIVLFNVGGIVANYPTELEYHWRNTFMEGDLVGETLEKLHKTSIKMIGRFDWISFYNHSGRLENSFHAPIPIDDIRIGLEISRPIKRITSLTNRNRLKTTKKSTDKIQIILPRLNVFEVVLVEFGN